MSINPLNSSIADSIFDKMDTNHDNVASKEEKLAFGFTTLGEDALSRDDFRSKFSVFAKKTSTQKGLLEDFEDVFYSGDGENLVYDVKLSEKQHEELLFRMEMFEAYQSILNDEEKEELAKNKSLILGLFNFTDDKPVQGDYKLPNDWSDEQKEKFKNICGVDYTDDLNDVVENRSGLKDYQHTQFKNFMNKDFKEIIENLRTGKSINITNEELSELLNLTKISDEISDGEIGTFQQGDLGDCWFLSQLNNYVQTEDGRQNIKERIINNGDGTYTVIFNNPFEQTKKETYCITEQELSKYDATSWDSIFDNIWSMGDKDVRILEIAFQKMLYEHIGKKYSSDDLVINSGDLSKSTFVHRALGYTDPCIMFYTDDNTLKAKQLTLNQKIGNINSGDIGDFPISYVLDINGISPENLTCSTKICQTSETKNEINAKYDGKIKFDHVYNFVRISDDNIVISNPQGTVLPLLLKKDNFDELFDTFFYFPINNRIPLSECSDL